VSTTFMRMKPTNFHQGDFFIAKEMTVNYRLCVILPTYNHYKALPSLLKELKPFSLDALIIDDGSNQQTKEALTTLEHNHSSIRVAHLPNNLGKGGALKHGLQWAKQLGYTHAFQIDADGQHDLSNLHEFIQTSQQNPHAVVSGHPQYDTTAPLARRFGRWMTNIWVWVETLSFRISESMCGFRIYPLQETLNVLNTESIGQRMEFDIEVMVRLFWQGTPTLMLPVKVTYPKGNPSTFNMVWDNWRITKMHTRLVFLMLLHLPKIFKNRPRFQDLDQPQEENRWFRLKEQGTFLGIYLMFSCYRLLGRRLSKILSTPVLFYYFLLGKKQRQASKQYLNRVFAFSEQKKTARLSHVFRHHTHFLEMMLDRLGAWTGKLNQSHIDSESLKQLKALTSQNQGGIFLVSHLGNIDILRACASFNADSKLHVLMHSENAQNFSKLLRKLNPQSTVNILEVSQIGPDVMIYLKERIDQGEWIAIAADRIPITGHDHVTRVPFLGHNASFPQGGYILASLLGCQVYTLIIIRTGLKFKVFLELFEEKVVIHRDSRKKDIENYTKKYSKLLEKYCLDYPYQWFNFYPYWNDHNA
jgi:predicted LPLAT superfamily acyltransferase